MHKVIINICRTNEHRVQAFSLRIFIPNERSQVHITGKNKAGGWLEQGKACRESGASPAEGVWPWPRGTQTQAGLLRPVRWQWWGAAGSEGRGAGGVGWLELARKERIDNLHF